MKRKVYTIFYDTGEWLWVKDTNDETMYVGTCISFEDDGYEKQLVSKELLDLTKAWGTSLSTVVFDERNVDTFDWANAHQKGLEVARRLKAELGDKADVRYVKPSYDPNRNNEEGYEVLSDGNIVPINRLRWCPV